MIPLSFLVGFYVAQVVARWWDQYKNMAWVDTVAMYLSGQLEEGLGKRRVDGSVQLTFLGMGTRICGAPSSAGSVSVTSSL